VEQAHAAQQKRQQLVDAHRWGFDTYQDQQLEVMLASVKMFARVLLTLENSTHPKGPWLSLLGASDNGKTHLARALYEFWQANVARFNNPINHENRGSFTITARRDGKLVVWPKLANRLRDPAAPKAALFRELADAPFLVVDDIGADMDTEFGRACLYNVAVEREGKPTVWTSNLFLDQISIRLDARLASRMERLGTVVQVDTCRHVTRSNQP
jgi:DNA replication protein DnaC